MIRAVLFDMDGVLVDTEWFYSRRREAYLAECGITYDVFPDLTGISTAETWEVLIPNDLGCVNVYVRHMAPIAMLTPFRIPSFSMRG